MDKIEETKLRIALTNMHGSWWSLDGETAEACARDMLDALYLSGQLTEEKWGEIRTLFAEVCGSAKPVERPENFDPPTQLTIEQ